MFLMKVNFISLKEVKLMIYKEFPNLVGVFARAFPIVCSRVKAQRVIETVSYYGKRYEIRPTGKDGFYEFHVFEIE